ERTTSLTESELQFSEDTIYFDTVFSSVGSVTKELRIINRGKSDLIVARFYLAGGSSSRFRLNIDGEPVTEKLNIRIESGDSIFIFIDVFIDPGNSSSPVAVNDSIIFAYGEKIRKVQLLAWGQDINLIKNRTINSETWTKGKPYVIYEKVIVDTLETLTIEAGTRILFHRNASMVIAGSIIVNGSSDSPVLFAGDRLEKMYEDIPGQWKGILILNSGKANNISHAIIRNAISGIRLGEAILSIDVPVLKLFSTVISHSTVSGLSAINGNIEAANCIFAHCGNYCVYLGSGGDYNFTNCTLFNSWDYGLRLTPALLITEKPEKPEVRISQMDVSLNNSVIYGDNHSELKIVPLNTIFTGNYYFDHCLVRLDTLGASFWDNDEFPAAIINKNPLFIDAADWDLRPDTLSPLINTGSDVFSA
ncbi:MAG: hypothetical protein C0408_10780, partial [Odoribacter sp.]|nr:hypothetical protein [Odoribacter sp.]